MRQIHYLDLSNQVYERLKDMILKNQFQPGEKLLQEKIAAQLGVSRTPLHKAFQMLENEFLVESIPRRGIFVKKIDLKQIYDAFECREAIEGVAARRLAKVIRKSQVDKLRMLFQPFMGKSEINNDAYQKADREFHNTLMRLSGNEILSKLDITGNILVRTYSKGLVRVPEETIQEHMSIIDALEKKDSELAELLIKMHTRKSMTALESMMSNE
jgi:DNA-binding GntR family transcriptional regulator